MILPCLLLLRFVALGCTAETSQTFAGGRRRGRVPLGRFEKIRRGRGSEPLAPVVPSEPQQERDEEPQIITVDETVESTAIAPSVPRILNVTEIPELPRMDQLDEEPKWMVVQQPQEPPWTQRLLRFRNKKSTGLVNDSHHARIRFDVSVESVSWSLKVWSLSTVRALVYHSASCFAGIVVRVMGMFLVQRAFLQIYNIGLDWYAGRYIRRTYERMGRWLSLWWGPSSESERQNNTQYRDPAFLRSVGRLVTHLTILFFLGDAMAWMVGLSHAPCQMVAGSGCHWWCGLLWIVAAAGTGHSAGVAISIWGRGLRLRIDASNGGRPSARRMLRRPWLLARWLLDPDKWLREVIARREPSHDVPFEPDFRLFPVTWRSLRVLQMIAVAREMYGGEAIMHTLMRRVLIQQAFGDEWFRVLICERRIALGMAVMIGYLLSTLALFSKIMYKPVASLSSVSILLAAPSVVAVALSAWMNVLEHLSRQQRKQISGATTPTNDMILAAEQYKRTMVLVHDRLATMTLSFSSWVAGVAGKGSRPAREEQQMVSSQWNQRGGQV